MRTMLVVVLAAVATVGCTSGKDESAIVQKVDLESTEWLGTAASLIKNGGGVVEVQAHADQIPVNAQGDICDTCSFVYFPSLTFDNGTIELEVSGERKEGSDEANKGFVGLVFAYSDSADTWEIVYLRPHNAVDPKNGEKAAQYVALPDYTWWALRIAETGGIEKGSKYEGSVRDVKPGEWAKMHVEVSEADVALTVNDEEVFRVNRLSSGPGVLGFYTEPDNVAKFRNLAIIPK